MRYLELIHYRSYSDEQQLFMLNISRLDIYAIRKKWLSFSNLNIIVILLSMSIKSQYYVKAEIQFIPDLVRILCKKGLAIYEVKVTEEQDALFDNFTAHMKNKGTL